MDFNAYVTISNNTYQPNQIHYCVKQDMSTYTYSAFGLTFQSQLQIPEMLLVDTQHCDVNIRIGIVPDSLSGSPFNGGIWQAAPGQFLLKVEEIASYYICSGCDITIEPDPGGTEDEVRAFLLGSGLAALLQQRHILTLHASAIQTEHGAVLFLGNSGAGKSTLLAALCAKGYPMLADDVTGVVVDDDNIPIALPSFPNTKLWADSISKLEFESYRRQRVRTELDKFSLKMVNFCRDAIPVHAIYFLSHHNQAHILLNTDHAIDQFKRLYQYTYRKKFLRGLQLQSSHFKIASKLLHTTKTATVKRPVHPFLLSELVETLEQDFAVNSDHLSRFVSC